MHSYTNLIIFRFYLKENLAYNDNRFLSYESNLADFIIQKVNPYFLLTKILNLGTFSNVYNGKHRHDFPPCQLFTKQMNLWSDI